MEEQFFHKERGTRLWNPSPKSVQLFKSGARGPQYHFFFETKSGTTFPLGIDQVIMKIV